MSRYATHHSYHIGGHASGANVSGVMFFTFTVSEAPTDFSVGSITAPLCVIPAFAAVSATVYTLVCDGDDDTAVQVSVGAGAFSNGNVTNTDAGSYGKLDFISCEHVCAAMVVHVGI